MFSQLSRFSRSNRLPKITSVSANNKNVKGHTIKPLRKRTLKVHTSIKRTSRIKDPFGRWLKDQTAATINSQIKRNFLNLNDYIRKLVIIEPPIIAAEAKSGICFWANLCHGTIPLNEKNQNVEIVEFVLPNNHTRVVKAPMATCPISQSHSHYNLIKEMLNYNTHGAIKTAIKNKELAENADIQNTKKENFIADFTGETSIADCPNNCYKEIVTQRGETSVNKIFSVNETDDDDGIYTLLQFTFKLPSSNRMRMSPIASNAALQNTVWKIMAEGHYRFSKPVTITIPIGTYINISEPYEFGIYYMNSVLESTLFMAGRRANGYLITSQEIAFKHNKPYAIHLPENTTFTVEKKNVNLINIFALSKRELVSRTFIMKELQIVNYFSDDGGNTILIYPYPIGILGNDDIITYIPQTNLLSCPFFIDYVKQIIETSVINNANQIIKYAKSLMYPYYHTSVIATCASIIASYFQHCEQCFSYDFSCQAYELIEKDGAFVSIEDFVIDAANLALLSRYAKGITKRKRKGKKANKKTQNKKTQNKLKRKIH